MGLPCFVKILDGFNNFRKGRVVDSHSAFAVFFIPFPRVQTEYPAIASGRVLRVCVLSPWGYYSAVCEHISSRSRQS